MSKTYKIADGKIRCTLCPHGCLIGEGASGICRVRKNVNGTLSLPYYGVLSAQAMDPIEKKPLFHFYPGSRIFSVGFYGCNFRCPFCQNYHISQQVVEGAAMTDPARLVEAAACRDSIGIAYTYSEPVVHYEFVLDTAKLARRQGLKNVLVTNGYINPDPAADLLEYMDAANVDLKSFNPDFYRKEIKGSLDPVLAFIEQAAPLVSLEVTTLVIPGKNDSEAEIQAIADFLASLSPDIPYHLSCYYPTYKYAVEATPPDLVLRLAEVAREKLHYVYAGNVGTYETDTLCPECGVVLIKRRGYSIQITGLSEGTCSNCGATVPIVG
ncbi:MAG: AmmeMemoRadiSam system radical SAM enzyme [Spirochaetales bacterium]|nr:AmmeMemoRadiSam system radical SAM enzyme [Spirochaetales bacterium]